MSWKATCRAWARPPREKDLSLRWLFNLLRVILQLLGSDINFNVPVECSTPVIYIIASFPNGDCICTGVVGEVLW